jgi:predicted flap endonuclease-1-like 5' DNA nuclease
VFSRGEIRLLGLTSALFLAGLGWRSAQARLSLPPLQSGGTALEWASQPLDDADSERVVPVRHARSSAHPRKISGTLDPNAATLAQLKTLPGIGPALAERIALERSQAPFHDADDLLRVKGIGPAKLEKLRPHLTF